MNLCTYPGNAVGQRSKSHERFQPPGPGRSPRPLSRVPEVTLVYFTTDVHGSERCFNKFVNAGAFYKADVLILGGDLTGKMIIPLVQQGDGSHLAHFLGSDQTVRGQEELQALVKKIRHAGYYPYITDQAEMDELNASREKVDALFNRLMGETMERWLTIAEEKLKPTGVRCYVTPGNDDRPIIDEVLSHSRYVENLEGKVIQLDEHHEMISTGWTNKTPWNSPRETTEEDLKRRIEAMASKVQRMETCLFNVHCPPIDTGLDSAPKLDEDLKQVTLGGSPVMISAGSTAVREAILKYQPLLALHGHIHESKGVCSLGRTLCFNPGSEYGEGILRGVLVKLSKKGYGHYLFTQG